MKHAIIHGDVVEVCNRIPEKSFDAVLCDPPYELGFMGKSWDSAGVSFNHKTWAAILRCCKPGAHLLAFGGSRTMHRITCAIEDGGWQIRDSLIWLYGSGFPKSMNVSKMLDKVAGAERDVIGIDEKTKARNPNPRNTGANLYGNDTRAGDDFKITAPATELAKQYHGYGTALKPAHEPIVLARAPLDGTVAANVAKYGCGALAIDATRVEYANPEDQAKMAAGVEKIRERGGVVEGSWKNSSDLSGANPASSLGRWPANVLLSHMDSCVQVGSKTVKAPTINRFTDGMKPFGNGAGHAYESSGGGQETIGVYDCDPNCPVRILDEQSGNRPGMSGGGKHKADYPGGMFGGIDSQGTARGDSGGASRFFYTTKVGKKERNAGLDDKNPHPTLKPIKLTEYLAKLILPPNGGRILIPFSGAGSEMIGAALAGWSEIVGVEQSAEYVDIANKRLAHWLKEPLG